MLSVFFIEIQYFQYLFQLILLVRNCEANQIQIWLEFSSVVKLNRFHDLSLDICKCLFRIFQIYNVTTVYLTISIYI